jgi:hypothetical protein
MPLRTILLTNPKKISHPLNEHPSQLPLRERTLKALLGDSGRGPHAR